MTWLSDTYATLKASWQRFERWERNFLFPNKEWRFTVYGTVGEFEQRFRFLLPTVPKKEFFNRDYEYRRYRNRAYFEDGEIGLLVPNPFLSFLTMGYFALIWTAYHEFYGYVESEDDQLMVRGTTSFGNSLSKLLTDLLNIFLVIGVASVTGGLVLVLWQLVSGAPLADVVASLALVAFGPLIAAFGFGTVYLFGSVEWALDRAASPKLRRVLEEVCGNPAQEIIK